MTELMPWAKGVSAKSYDFDEEGNDTKIDYSYINEFIKKNHLSSIIEMNTNVDKWAEAIVLRKAANMFGSNGAFLKECNKLRNKKNISSMMELIILEIKENSVNKFKTFFKDEIEHSIRFLNKNKEFYKNHLKDYKKRNESIISKNGL